MAIIAMVSPKGGAGKTTGAVLLAGELLRLGWSVSLVDADPNKPLARWAAKAAHLIPKGLRLVFDSEAGGVADTIDGEAQRSAHVIVDLPGRAGDATVLVITLADLVLIPLYPSDVDLGATEKTFALVRQVARQTRQTVRWATYWSRTEVAIRDRVQAEVEAQVHEMRGVHVMNTALSQRSAFKKILAQGGTQWTVPERGIRNLPVARANCSAWAREALDMFPADERRA